MHFLCRIAASLGRCIAAPPSVFCRYLLILSLNLVASFYGWSPMLCGWSAHSQPFGDGFVGCSWPLLAANANLAGQSGFLRDFFASFA
ncbi:hypothetical protein V8C86DRAFT_2578370, partial [Haematococcus lacustris]